jgi:hypothetical protein
MSRLRMGAGRVWSSGVDISRKDLKMNRRLTRMDADFWEQIRIGVREVCFNL